ncbi:MAG: hypothetical protein U1E70_29330 [Acetobacteraceae bacterium]
MQQAAGPIQSPARAMRCQAASVSSTDMPGSSPASSRVAEATAPTNIALSETM